MAKFDLNDSSVVVIVGSGAGGGTLGNELAQKGVKVVILEAGGTVAQVGSVEDIVTKPANDFVRSFVGLDRGSRQLRVERRNGSQVVVDGLGRPAGVLSA